MDVEEDDSSTSSCSVQVVPVPSSVGSIDGRRTVASALMSQRSEADSTLSEFVPPSHKASGDDVRKFLKKLSDGKSGNLHWQCACLVDGHGTSRAVEHIRKCKKANKTDMGKWIAETYTSRKRGAGAELDPNKKGRATGSSSIKSYHVEPTAKGTLQSVNDAVAEYFIVHNIPNSHIESKPFNKMRSEFEEAGRKGMAKVNFGCAKTFEERVILPVIERERTSVLDLHAKVAKTHGVTVVIDGRKNAAKKPMEAMMIETKQGSALVKNRSPPPGKKKNGVWYLDLLETNLVTFEDAGPFQPILECTVAVVTDGATAPVIAAGNLEKKHGILAVLCQLHALNRLIVHLFDLIDPLKSLMADTNTFFDAFLDIQRFREYLESKTGKSIFRFVNTRMIYIPVVFGRLLELKSKIKDAVLSEEFKTLIELPETTASERTKANKAKGIVRSDVFWGRVHFASKAFLAVTLLARELDRGIPNIAVCYWGWYNLSKSLRSQVESFECEIQHEDGEKSNVKVLSSGDAIQVQQIVAKDMQKYIRPVMAAAFMLFPAFHAEREEMKQEDRDLYMGLRADTRSVLGQMLGRFHPTQEAWEALSSSDLPRLNPIGKTPTEVNARLSKHVDNQLDNFLAKSGSFSYVDYDKEVDAATWFSEECPDAHLSFLGQRIFQIVPVGSNLERTHKQNTLVHSSKRNRLKAQKVDDLVRAKQSILLRQKIAQGAGPDRRFLRTDDFFRRFEAALKCDTADLEIIEEIRQDQVRRAEADASMTETMKEEPTVVEDIKVVTLEEDVEASGAVQPSSSAGNEGGLEMEDMLSDDDGQEDDEESVASTAEQAQDQTEPSEIGSRRSGRIRVLPKHLRDFICNK